VLRLASDFPVAEVGKHEVLGVGSRKVHTAPELYPGGIEAMRGRWGGTPAALS
jgi:hypothetical protein